MCEKELKEEQLPWGVMEKDTGLGRAGGVMDLRGRGGTDVY